MAFLVGTFVESAYLSHRYRMTRREQEGIVLELARAFLPPLLHIFTLNIYIHTLSTYLLKRKLDATTKKSSMLRANVAAAAIPSCNIQLPSLCLNIYVILFHSLQPSKPFLDHYLR